MGRYVSSVSDNRRITKSMQELAMEIKSQRQVQKRTNKELAKINEESERLRQDKVEELSEEIRKLETASQWVESSEPAFDVDTGVDHIMKKLNVL